jgi:hypothetical protein
MIIQGFNLGEVIVGLPLETTSRNFWSNFISSAVISVLMNLAFGIANIIGPRAFLNFVTGRYHFPVEESRFVLSSTSRDRPGWLSGLEDSRFTVFSTVRFACSPLRWWIIAARFSIMSATR